MFKIKITKVLKDIISMDEDSDFQVKDTKLILNDFSSISNLKKKTIIWATEESYLSPVSTKTNLVIVGKDCEFKKNLSNYIEVSNPRSAFFSLLKKYNPVKIENGIDQKANVSKKCKLGENIFIGANTTICDDVEIGDNTVILNNVVISNKVKIGENCFIKSNSIIGEECFGVDKDKEGNLFDIPHLGGVRIGHNVKIGSLSTIASGTLDPTIISNYVKIDDHVHIAHNVKIGENSIITAGVNVGGSVLIMKNVWLGIGSVITNGIKIGSDSFIGAGANILSDIGENIKVLGTPGKQVFRIKGN